MRRETVRKNLAAVSWWWSVAAGSASLLAGRLSHAGSSVVVIDRNEAAFDIAVAGVQRLPDRRRRRGAWPCCRRAKVHKAGCLLAVTEDDNVNLMVAQVAHEIFEVPRVMARVSTPGGRRSTGNSASRRSAQPSCRPTSSWPPFQERREELS